MLCDEKDLHSEPNQLDERGDQMERSARDGAIKLLAQANVARDSGNPERSIELLNDVIALGEGDEAFKHDHPYQMAHVLLYRIHRACRHDMEALDYYIRAASLGVSYETLAEEG